ncbi:hypothetical protein ACQPX6_02695 [Actinomycetospora sp. CA-101289]|uniref:hypothetical protein n=1 Tax=Actinomycetospora sp. CA-101289 TaxID=3239893 RepID=UPI003D978CF3
MSDRVTSLQLDDLGVAQSLPRPGGKDQILGVPYRPVQFLDDDLPKALERAATWLREVEQWLGEAPDVIAVHLDHDETQGSPYFDLTILCNDEDLAGAPIAVRERDSGGGPRRPA